MQQTENHSPAPPEHTDHTAARAYFPRGMSQPRNGYRFSSDALLLGSFLHPAPHARVLDLGTGCAAAALAMLCRRPSLNVTGVDIQSEYLAAAGENAARLGFGQAFTALCADVADVPEQPGAFDHVIANPPYRQRDRGRLPANPSRLLALFEKSDTLAAFCECAARALRPGGSFGILFPAQRQDELQARLRAARLTPVRLLCVSSHAGAKPRVILVEAVKKNSFDVYHTVIDKQSIVIHTTARQNGKQRSNNTFSAEALRFCPFLSPSAAENSSYL